LKFRLSRYPVQKIALAFGARVRKGEAIVPIHPVVRYSDSSSFSVTRKIGCWSDGRKSLTIIVPADRGIVRVELGAPYDADIDHSNNVWPIAP